MFFGSYVPKPVSLEMQPPFTARRIMQDRPIPARLHRHAAQRVRFHARQAPDLDARWTFRSRPRRLKHADGLAVHRDKHVGALAQVRMLPRAGDAFQV